MTDHSGPQLADDDAVPPGMQVDPPPLDTSHRELVWCPRCGVHHECFTNHGPDGHGGSSVCCPIRREEIAAQRAKATAESPDPPPCSPADYHRRTTLAESILRKLYEDPSYVDIANEYVTIDGHTTLTPEEHAYWLALTEGLVR